MKLSKIERMIIESSYWFKKRKREVIILFSGIKSAKKVLNVGSGRINLTRNLIPAKTGLVLNIDIEKFLNIDSIADALNLPFEDKGFDIIVFLRVLHHIDDFYKALREAHRCLKPGGYILFSEPYSLFVYILRFLGFNSHPKNIIINKDINNFVNDNNLIITNKWKRIFLFYYGYQIKKSEQKT